MRIRCMKPHVAVLALFLPVSLVHADDPALRDYVLDNLARQTQKHFYFVQEKKLAMLDKPLITEGELLFDSPPQDNNHPQNNNHPRNNNHPQNNSHTLTWDIQKPYTLRYVLTRDSIREIDTQGERTIQASQNPVAAALTAAMTSTFSGQWRDNDTLATITATGSTAAWQLQITPLAAELQPLIKIISVTGHDGIISSVEIAESNGDSTTIRLTIPAPP